MKKNIDFISSNFTVAQTNSYSLSIRQQPDGYSFCVMDYDIKQCQAIKHIKYDKSAALHQEPLLQISQYKRILYFGYGPYSIVPDTFLTATNQASFLPIDNNLKNRAETIIRPIFDKSFIVSHANQWSYPSDITVEPHHEIELLAVAAQNNNTETAVWAEILCDRINIIALRSHKPELINTYDISDYNDAAYFILAVYQQLQFNNEEVPLYITGDLMSINPNKLLSNYIRSIIILKPEYWNKEFNNNYAAFFNLQTQAHLI